MKQKITLLLLILISGMAGLTAVTQTLAQPLPEATAVGLNPTLEALPQCVQGTTTHIDVIGSAWPDNDDIALYWTAPGGTPQLQTTILAADHVGAFSLRWLKSNLMAGYYTVQAISPSYTRTDTVTVQMLVPPCTTTTYTPTTPIITSRTAENGLLNTSNQAIYGPNICTDYGDPYSPLNSPWDPGTHTYHYEIHIPSTYTTNTLRVELFDPDSMNKVANNVTIDHTDYAIAHTFPATEDLDCVNDAAAPSSDLQKNQCLIKTGEEGLATGSTTIDDINLYWFMRVDANRGAVPAPGSGACGAPNAYNAFFNTQTLFQLYYYERVGTTLVRQDLAKYTGQTGDGLRDDGDHFTDLRWVSPGGTQSVDQPVPVPTDVDSPSDFELDLSQDVPGIFHDPRTGERVLYLEVTTLSGGSENDFDVWAGPASYVATVPSNVNARNVYMLNHPGAHSSMGVEVTSQDYLPLNHHYDPRHTFPLVELSPEYAGRTIQVTAFDIDNNAQRPLIFTAEDLPGWSLTFGITAQATDPDGVPAGIRCYPACSNQWIEPYYSLALPQNFPGGRILVSFDGGVGDAYGWKVIVPPLEEVALDGPEVGFTNVDYSFLAVSTFVTPSDHITYTWTVDGQTPLSHTNGFLDTAVYQWPRPGMYQVNVSADNGFSTVTATHVISINPVLLSSLTLTGPVTSTAHLSSVFTATVGPLTVTQPITYLWQITGPDPLTATTPITQMIGGGLTATAVITWEHLGWYTVTVVADNGFNALTATQRIQVYPSHNIFLPMGLRGFTPSFVIHRP